MRLGSTALNAINGREQPISRAKEFYVVVSPF